MIADDRVARRGRMLATGTVDLPLGLLAALLGAAVFRPAEMIDPVEQLDRELAALWADLHAVDPDLAAQALHCANGDGADASTIVQLAEMLGTQAPTKGTR